MFAYGVDVLQMARGFKESHSCCMQSWYADDAGSVGHFDEIETFFKNLVKIGPAFGYILSHSQHI